MLSEHIREYIRKLKECPKIRAKASVIGGVDQGVTCTLSLRLHHPVVADFAAELMRFYRALHGINFVDLMVVDPVNAQSILITTRLHEGIMPAQIVNLLRGALTEIAANKSEPGAVATAEKALHTCNYLSSGQTATTEPPRPVSSEGLDRLYKDVGTGQQMLSLTAAELILEVLRTDAADQPAVIELMNRIMPGWQDNEEIKKGMQ